MKKIGIFILAGIFVSVLVIGYGAVEDQVNKTRSYSSVLCVSCLGIQEIAPELSFQQKAELTKVQNHVELLLFTAKWCLDCPRAHDFVESIHQATLGKVSYVEIDILENQELADEHGIRCVPAVIIGSTKLEGLDAIRSGLIQAIVELSGGQS